MWDDIEKVREVELLKPWGGAGVRQVGLRLPQGLRMTGVGADEIGGVRNEIEIVVSLGDKMVKLIEFIELITD